MGELYRLDFPNGKSYVGITKGTAARRFARHCGNASRPDKAGLAVSRAILKYGRDAITCRTLVVAEWPYLVALEQRAIAAFGTKSPAGYNLTDGGEGTIGQVVSEAARSRMSAASAAAWSKTEHRARMSEMRKGKKRSAAARAKQSEAALAVWSDSKYRARLSESQLAAWAIAGDARRAAFRAAVTSDEAAERLRAARTTDEFRASASASVRALWQDPEYRDRMLKAQAAGKAAAALRRKAK